MAGVNVDKTLEMLVYAALPHVAFEGWSQAALTQAAADSGLTLAQAQALVPRGGVDLALAYHRLGDQQMVAALAEQDLQAMRFRDRVTLAVRLRLQDTDAEAVRRGTALLSLPLYAAEGAHIIDLLFELNSENNTTLILVTHDRALAARCGRTIQLDAGQVSA